MPFQELGNQLEKSAWNPHHQTFRHRSMGLLQRLDGFWNSQSYMIVFLASVGKPQVVGTQNRRLEVSIHIGEHNVNEAKVIPPCRTQVNQV